MQTMIATIQNEIDAILRDHAPDADDDEPAGKCLYIAHAVATVLHRHGLRPVIQAGSPLVCCPKCTFG